MWILLVLDLDLCLVDCASTITSVGCKANCLDRFEYNTKSSLTLRLLLIVVSDKDSIHLGMVSVDDISTLRIKKIYTMRDDGTNTVFVSLDGLCSLLLEAYIGLLRSI